jgi:hypothetical protein
MTLDNSEHRHRRIALATCRELPELDGESQLLAAALQSRGIEAVAAVWDDASIDWTSFDLVIVRSCWDYIYRHNEFLRWAAGLPQLKNSAAVCEWNSNKRYLSELARQGLPVVPTKWITPSETWIPPNQGEWVIKPSVSLCALGTGRYNLADPTQNAQFLQHLQRLRQSSHTVMAQPYLTGIEREGETALVFFRGRFSHAVRKPALLTGPDTGEDRRFRPFGGITPVPVAPTSEQLALAERVLASVPGGASELLYARVDLVPADSGDALVLELEAIEPNLFLTQPITAREEFASHIQLSLRAFPAPHRGEQMKQLHL